MYPRRPGYLNLLSSLSELWYRWNYQVEKQSFVGSLLFDGLQTAKNSCQLRWATERKSHHNSTIKPPIQNPPISFQDNIPLHVSELNFQWTWRTSSRKLSAETHTNTQQLLYALGSAHRGIITDSCCVDLVECLCLFCARSTTISVTTRTCWGMPRPTIAKNDGDLNSDKAGKHYTWKQVGRSSGEHRLVRTVGPLTHSHAEVIVLANAYHDCCLCTLVCLLSFVAIVFSCYT